MIYHKKTNENQMTRPFGTGPLFLSLNIMGDRWLQPILVISLKEITWYYSYLLDRPAFSTAKAFNLYLFFTGHDIWGSQFIFTSLWLPPAYTKMCHYVTNSNWIFWKVCTTTQTHISNYTLLQFLAHIYLGKLIESF